MTTLERRCLQKSPCPIARPARGLLNFRVSRVGLEGFSCSVCSFVTAPAVGVLR
jgi:hypothetical protein